MDVIEGRGPAPLFVIALVQGLPEDSLTSALMSGGRHLFGWTRLLSVATDIFDATNLNTQMTGMWGGKPPKLPLGHRPGAPEAEDAPKRKRTAKEAHASFFSRGG